MGKYSSAQRYCIVFALVLMAVLISLRAMSSMWVNLGNITLIRVLTAKQLTTADGYNWSAVNDMNAQVDVARQSFSKALSEAPENCRALWGLAKVNVLLRNRDRAAEITRLARLQCPPDLLLGETVPLSGQALADPAHRMEI